MRRRDLLKSALPLAVGAKLLALPMVPRPAQELSIAMPMGRLPIRLSQYRGKVILLEFLLTFCQHCQKASRTAEIMYQEYGQKGLAVIGAAINPEGDPAQYSANLGLTFPVGKVQDSTCYTFLQLQGMRPLFPQVAFIDRNMTIVEQHQGGDEFFQDEERNFRLTIERMLKITNGTAKAPSKKKG